MQDNRDIFFLPNTKAWLACRHVYYITATHALNVTKETNQTCKCKHSMKEIHSLELGLLPLLEEVCNQREPYKLGLTSVFHLKIYINEKLI